MEYNRARIKQNMSFLKHLLILLIFTACNSEDKPQKKEIKINGTYEVINTKEVDSLFIEKDTKSIKISPELKDEGFIRINLYELYNNNKDLVILSDSITKDSLIVFKGKTIMFSGNSYDLMKNTPYDLFKSEAFYPDYNLFIIKTNGEYENGYYEVLINETKVFISTKYSNLLKHQTKEEYLLSTYPLLNKETPLKESPDNNSETISNYEEYSYKPVEINGDWLKLIDDKDCPLKDTGNGIIEGWVKWIVNGEIILDLRHSC